MKGKSHKFKTYKFDTTLCCGVAAIIAALRLPNILGVDFANFDVV